jgi:hypothetical protein
MVVAMHTLNLNVIPVTNAYELHDVVRPLQVAVYGLPSRKQPLGHALADDHHAFRAVTVRCP